VSLATIRGGAAAAALSDVLTNDGIEVAWGNEDPPRENGDPEALFEVRVPPDDVERGRGILAEWADADVIVTDGVTRDGEPAAALPDISAGQASDEPIEAASASPLRLSGLRHCPACGAEFDGSRCDCSDCGAALVGGPSQRYASSANPPPAVATAADEEVSPSDFVTLVTVKDGSSALGLWGMLEEAGIATLNTGPRHTQLRAPGSEPVGDDLWGVPVRVAVFPEDLARAKALLAEWAEQDAIVDEGDSVQPAQHAPTAEPTARPLPAAPAVARSSSEPGTDWLTLALIASVLGVLVLLGARLFTSR
jgi:hypothetical protein